MLDLILLPLLMQLATAPDDFFEPVLSAETTAAVEQRGERDGKAITRTLEALADAGDTSALEALGEIYNGGLFGVKRDPRRGCDYYERAAASRPDAMHNLATCYFNGDGRRLDQAKARELYIAAAQAGWRMSFCAYGNMLVRGEGGAVDAAEGIRLCRMTAVLGDRDAQTDYGTYLLTGNGVDRDPVAARFMLEQAGAQGQRNAAFLLGQVHSKGDGTATDHIAAAEWFERAYEWGRDDAAFATARAYLRQGYSEREDGGVTLKPELLRKARQWLATAIEVAPEGSEERAEAEQVDQAIGRMLAAAQSEQG